MRMHSGEALKSALNEEMSRNRRGKTCYLQGPMYSLYTSIGEKTGGKKKKTHHRFYLESDN